MFNLVPHVPNNAALTVAAGLSLTPIAAALENSGYRQNRAERSHIRIASVSSVNVNSDPLNLFSSSLNWLSEKLGFSSAEKLSPEERLHTHKKEGRVLLNGIGEGKQGTDAWVSYLNSGVKLVDEGILDPEEWCEQLTLLKLKSLGIGMVIAEDGNVVETLSSLIEKLKSLKESSNIESEHTPKSPENHYGFFANPSESIPENLRPTPIVGECPSGADLKYDNTTGKYEAQGGWYQSYPDSVPPAKKGIIAFDSANVMNTPSGEAACLYGIGLKGTSIILENDHRKDVKGIGPNWIPGRPSLFWPTNTSQPASSCPAVPDMCQFANVAPKP